MNEIYLSDNLNEVSFESLSEIEKSLLHRNEETCYKATYPSSEKNIYLLPLSAWDLSEASVCISEHNLSNLRIIDYVNVYSAAAYLVEKIDINKKSYAVFTLEETSENLIVEFF